MYLGYCLKFNDANKYHEPLWYDNDTLNDVKN